MDEVSSGLLCLYAAQKIAAAIVDIIRNHDSTDFDDVPPSPGSP